MSAAALGVNAALANGIGHAVNCEHVGRNAIVDAVSFRITDNVFESGLHDVLELLVDHRLLPEVALSVLHPLEVGSGHAAGIAQNVGNNEYSLVRQDSRFRPSFLIASWQTTMMRRPVASRRPREPPMLSGLPVTTAVTVWRMCME